MINGLPGNMASLVETALSQRTDIQIIPFSLTGPGMDHCYTGKDGNIGLYAPHEHAKIMQAVSEKLCADGLIAIDFTQPSGIEENVKRYCANKIPFIAGTTGGNREILPQLVEASEISAVIATNMSAPVVMLVDMIARAATDYPDTLKDWEIRITESHQAKKEDISGTALTIGKIMKGLGVKFIGPENIHKVRDKVDQLFMGIPKDALSGHGWHKYSLRSPDDNVMLGFEHNINGRDTYVEGTLKALDFLVKEVAAGSQGHCFSMQDVMRG
ncbi:MAG: dihydrodipicolinate reductase C-terminal domain-containing protein [Parcubacteria group bacterium]